MMLWTVCAGAELANVLNEGALEAVRRGSDIITRTDVYNGIDRVLQAGPCLPPHTSITPASHRYTQCAFSFLCRASP